MYCGINRNIYHMLTITYFKDFRKEPRADFLLVEIIEPIEGRNSMFEGLAGGPGLQPIAPGPRRLRQLTIRHLFDVIRITWGIIYTRIFTSRFITFTVSMHYKTKRKIIEKSRSVNQFRTCSRTIRILNFVRSLFIEHILNFLGVQLISLIEWHCHFEVCGGGPYWKGRNAE